MDEVGFTNCHRFQRDFCRDFPDHRPILNVACKEDPGRIGADFGATNTDLLTEDPHTNTDMEKDVPNFIQGDAMDLPFDDGSYKLLVIGELLEHCTLDAATKVLQEAKRVCHPEGYICLTFPLDGRGKREQHPEHLLIEWANGITSWHQTVWHEGLQDHLFKKVGLTVVSRSKIGYAIPKVNHGFGVVLKP